VYFCWQENLCKNLCYITSHLLRFSVIFYGCSVYLRINILNKFKCWIVKWIICVIQLTWLGSTWVTLANYNVTSSFLLSLSQGFFVFCTLVWHCGWSMSPNAMSFKCYPLKALIIPLVLWNISFERTYIWGLRQNWAHCHYSAGCYSSW
jgi:hypothetical protein